MPASSKLVRAEFIQTGDYILGYGTVQSWRRDANGAIHFGIRNRTRSIVYSPSTPVYVKRRNRHALYATTTQRDGTTGPTFRVGQPCTHDTAHNRFERADRNGRGLGPARPLHVRFDGRKLRVKFLEVRAVDQDGRGLGSDRHTLAFPVPHRNLRLVNPR